MTTVDKIFQLIQENNLTAKEFAFMCKLSAGNVTDWKTGRSKPSIEAVKKISSAFNVNIAWLLGESNIIEKETYFDDLKIPKDFQYYIEDLPKCIQFQIKDITHLLITINGDFDKIEKNIDWEINYRIPFKYRKDSKIAIKYLYNYHIRTIIDNEPYLQYKIKSNNNYTSSNQIESIKFQKVPMIGKIAAGQPILAQENIEGYLPVDPNIYGMTTTEDLFYLRVSR